MRLLVKFNLILILVFGSGVVIAGFLSHRFLERSARSQVLEQARLMMGAAGGMRTYTSEQVGPLLNAHQERINGFLPSSCPPTRPRKSSPICALLIPTKATRKLR